MKFALPILLGDHSDRAWRWFGKHDPYYGVLSDSQYRKENLTAERFQSFFDSGRAHVDRVLGLVSHHLGDIRTESCLDFGCGVGRIVVPLAARFRRVTGIDISRAMIDEASRNCERFGVNNVEFLRTPDEAGGRYDLVHSYIVLQHIPVRRGMAIIDRLVNLLAPSGACFLHVTIGRKAGVFRDLATFLRKNIKPLHCLLNAYEGKRLNEAYMQSNEYRLNELVAYLYRHNITQIWLETENHGGPYSVCLIFRAPRPEQASS
jgi:2-polyprenyl-3-methyl-5-hydroxy-6-metoxy-1,4-benzoquinol methylase